MFVNEGGQAFEQLSFRELMSAAARRLIAGLYASFAFNFECQAIKPRDRHMGARGVHGVIACRRDDACSCCEPEPGCVEQGKASY